MATTNCLNKIISSSVDQGVTSPLSPKNGAAFIRLPDSSPGNRRVAMFETLMKNGRYRVDYLNHSVCGKEEALALYVCGSLRADEVYSHSAKRKLYEGLDWVWRNFGRQNLVAVYLDVCLPESVLRPAYQRMKKDLEAGMFHRVAVSGSENFQESQMVRQALAELYHQKGDFELFLFAFQPDQSQTILLAD
ncbi:MAG: hypothetical protein HPY59_09220 [Anaerolineae bacterium]|nr:hypothetical protein [Anaerolineae bacterium]